MAYYYSDCQKPYSFKNKKFLSKLEKICSCFPFTLIKWYNYFYNYQNNILNEDPETDPE